jgi:primosomal protein N' (replication factor Y) (superfamily II helicase)
MVHRIFSPITLSSFDKSVVFDTELPVSSESATVAHLTIARVALDTPLDRLFDYLALDALADDIGRRVEVPFGNRRLIGVLVELTDHSDLPLESLKPLHAIDRGSPPLPPDLLALAHFVCGYYHHALGAVLAMMLPPALRRIAKLAKTRQELPGLAYRLTPLGRAGAEQIPARFTARKRLAERMLAVELPWASCSTGDKAVLRAWLELDWIEPIGKASEMPPQEAMPALTDEQESVLAALRAAGNGFNAFLLHGVTGSGKTEVYLRLVADIPGARSAGAGAGAGNPPDAAIDRAIRSRRFPDRRLVGSAQQSGRRRAAQSPGWMHWKAVDIVLGTRLAVFTPLPRLGLIIVDEEHDSAYKQMEGMRYSARDVAVWRARERGVPVLLGSATPALESWRNAKEGRYNCSG